MKIIIAGSRSIYSEACLQDCVNYFREQFGDITEVVCGKASGMDTCGENWANEWDIPVKEFEVTKEEWKRIGKGAGHIRNKAMADYAEGAIIIWDGQSPGSKNMIELSMAKRKKDPSFNVLVCDFHQWQRSTWFFDGQENYD